MSDPYLMTPIINLPLIFGLNDDSRETNDNMSNNELPPAKLPETGDLSFIY